ncbi:MAG: glycine cleavage system protein GcvH [Rikenellaceae bacterium]|nr:glycine cleavage system protein GcvH [Rikenellaceae bacterium]
MNIPSELKYSKDHEWVKLIENNIALVGITDFAQDQLGDIVFIDVPTVGEKLNREDVFGTVEAVKTVSDIFLPVDAKIIEFNEDLDGAPESVNTDPYGEGWIVKIEIKDLLQIEELLSADEYRELIG